MTHFRAAARPRARRAPNFLNLEVPADSSVGFPPEGASTCAGSATCQPSQGRRRSKRARCDAGYVVPEARARRVRASGHRPATGRRSLAHASCCLPRCIGREAHHLGAGSSSKLHLGTVTPGGDHVWSIGLRSVLVHAAILPYQARRRRLDSPPSTQARARSEPGYVVNLVVMACVLPAHVDLRRAGATHLLGSFDIRLHSPAVLCHQRHDTIRVRCTPGIQPCDYEGRAREPRGHRRAQVARPSPSCAFVRSAPRRSAFLRSVFLRSRPRRFAPVRRAPLRLAPARRVAVWFGVGVEADSDGSDTACTTGT